MSLETILLYPRRSEVEEVRLDSAPSGAVGGFLLHLRPACQPKVFVLFVYTTKSYTINPKMLRIKHEVRAT